MAKNNDFWFQFFPQKWLSGTAFMTFEQKGLYITLLCHQHQTGRMSEETIRLLLGLTDWKVWEAIRDKFEKDDDDRYYNAFLDEQISKRVNVNTVKAENGKKGGRPKSKTEPNQNLMVNQNNNQMVNHQGNLNETYSNFSFNSISNTESINNSESSIISIGGMQGGNYEPNFWENFYDDFRNAYGAYGYPYKRWDVIEHLRGAVANVLGKWKEINYQGDYHDAAEFLTQCANLAQQADTNAKRDKRKAPHNWLADHNYLTNPADILPKKKTESELLREAITKAAQNIKP
jgi:uncharacterized protein YdaU (DUF1376 family)